MAGRLGVFAEGELGLYGHGVYQPVSDLGAGIPPAPVPGRLLWSHWLRSLLQSKELKSNGVDICGFAPIYLVGLSPEVPAPHDIFSGGLSSEAPGYEDLLRG